MASSSRSTHLCSIAGRVKEEDKNLVNILTQLDEGCSEFEKFYSEYDYDADTPANGYRFFVSMIDALVPLIAQQVPATSRKKKKALQDYETAAATLIKVMGMLRVSRSKGSDYDLSQITDEDIDILEQVFSMNESDVAPFFKQTVGPFWLQDFAGVEKRHAAKALTFLTGSSWHRVRMLFSSSYALRVTAADALCLDVHKMKHVTMKFNRFPLKLLLKLGPKVKGVTSSVVHIDRSSEWVINVKDAVTPAAIQKSGDKREGSVRCLLVKPKPKGNQIGAGHDGKSLLVHIHGGAFIVGTPDMMLSFLTPTTAEFNLPIISIDYALAPENKYPAGIQDVLDVYLFLTSGSEKVQQLLGFQPTNIVLAGESAGGNMAIALAIALQMISRTGAPVIMPKGVSIQFPCAVAAPVGYPSNAFFSMDPTLTAALCGIVFTEYAEVDPPAPHGWHRESGRKEVMKRLRERAKDPLFNILSGTHVEELKHVSLSILVCEFDPLTDHGIAIAKRWGGDVEIRVARGMPHGLSMTQHDKIKDEIEWIRNGQAKQLGLKNK